MKLAIVMKVIGRTGSRGQVRPSITGCGKRCGAYSSHVPHTLWAVQQPLVCQISPFPLRSCLSPCRIFYDRTINIAVPSLCR